MWNDSQAFVLLCKLDVMAVHNRRGIQRQRIVIIVKLTCERGECGHVISEKGAVLIRVQSSCVIREDYCTWPKAVVLSNLGKQPDRLPLDAEYLHDNIFV